MAKSRVWAMAVAVAGLAVGACSPLGVLDAIVPDDTYKATAGLAYGGDKRQMLDVYRPLQGGEPAPVVVFFYGGSWKSGDRGKYRFVGEALASRGIVTVVPDYRLYPAVRYPAFLEDSAAAVAWVKREIAAYGGDPHRLFVAGHSAGAYNAAMLAVQPAFLEGQGLSPADLCGVVSIAGPNGVNLQDYNITRPVFAHVDNPETTRPAALVQDGNLQGAPPFLLIHGLADSTVYALNTQRFETALQDAALPVEAVYIPDIGHYRIMAAVADPLEDWAGPVPIADLVADFVRRQAPCRG